MLAALFSLLAGGQELPQFTHTDFEGWDYNNPNVPLTSDNISGYKITIYVSSSGRVLTLTSPDFSCEGLDSIHADVVWKSYSIDVALIMALDNEDGTPIDSVSCYPPLAISANQTLRFTLAVPDSVSTARVRFFSPEANVNTGGVIRKVTLTGLTAVNPQVLVGDVDGNGSVNIRDVTVLISYILNGEGNIDLDAADTDGSDVINIGDVTHLIAILLNR